MKKQKLVDELSTQCISESAMTRIAFLRRSAVEKITGLSRSSIYAGVAKKTFPRPVRLTANAVGWIEAEIQRWAEERVKGRDAISARRGTDSSLR